MYCSPVFQAQNSPKKPKILAGVLTIAITCLKALAQRLHRAFFLRKKEFLFRHIFALGNSLRKKLVLFMRKLSPSNIIIYKGVNQKILETKNKEEKEMKLRKILLASTLSMVLALTTAATAFAETEEAVPISADADMPIMVQSQNIKTVLPKLTAKSYSYSKNKLSWDAVSGAGGYEVFRATSKTGKFQKVSAIAAEKTSYINTGLTCGKTYWYKLRAYQVKNGKKVYSKYSDVKSTYPKPSKVKDASVKFSNRDFVGFEINWKKTNGADGYQLQFKPGNGKWSTYYREYNSFTKRWENTYPDEFKGKKERFNVKYIVLGTEASWATGYSEDSYSFRVRAYKTVNGKKVFGLYSEPTTIKPVWKSGKELQDFVHTWVDENYPTYDRALEERINADVYPEKDGVNWGTTWTWYTINQYTTKENILKYFCEGTLRYYFGAWWGYAENTTGILYTRDLGDGLYQVWWIN